MFLCHPNLGSIANLFSENDEEAKEAALNFVQQVMNIKQELMPKATFNEVLQVNPDLDRPLLAVLNTSGASHSDLKPDAVAGSHWVALVILPKTQTHNGIDAERVFFYDSINSSRKIPSVLVNYLTKEELDGCI